MLNWIDAVDQHPIQNLAIKAISFDCHHTPTKGRIATNNPPLSEREHRLDANHYDKQRSNNRRQGIYGANIAIFLHGIWARLDAVFCYR